MKHILFVATVYRIGERVHPIIPKLAENYKLSLLTIYQMKMINNITQNIKLILLYLKIINLKISFTHLK